MEYRVFVSPVYFLMADFIEIDIRIKTCFIQLWASYMQLLFCKGLSETGLVKAIVGHRVE